MLPFIPRLRPPVLVLALLLQLLPVPGFAAHAAEVRTLTLDQALAIAGERNRGVARALEYRNLVAGRYVTERAAALPHFTLNGNLSREHDGALDSSELDRRDASIELNQALFTWGEVQAAIRAARIGMQTADEQLRFSRQAALRDASRAFYDVLLARELNRVVALNLEQKSRRLAEARRRRAVGVATDYDVLVAEVAEANARPEVLRTAKLIDSRRDRLRLVLGLDQPVDAEGGLAATLVDPPGFDEALAIAREQRPDLRDLAYRIGIAEELVTVASAGDKPRLDLQGSTGWKDLETDRARNDGNAWDIGLKLTWPIFDGLKARGEVQQARSERDSLRIDQQQLLDTVELETREALDQVRVASELVRALDGTVAQAERLLALSEKGFEFGVKIRLEVDDAELNLRQARSSLAIARRDYLVAMVELAWAMGVLGERSIPGLPVAAIATGH
ncbi:MAG: TolC family protein [Desulfuromonas sp.]|nr:TolC family protein [Desulfuromonas sp.]